MQKFILLTILFLITVFGITQTFEKYHKTSFDDIVYDAIEINVEEIVFALNYGDYFNSDYNAKLYKINHFSGNYIDSCEIILNNIDYKLIDLGKVFFINQYTLVVIGHCSNINTGDRQIFLAHYNIYLEHIMDTIVGDIENDEWFFDVIYSSDELLVFSGMEETGIISLEERNIFGELVRKKTYTQGGSLASTVYELPIKNKYHLFRYWDTNHSFYIIDKNDLSVDTIVEYPLGFLPRNTIKGLDTSYYYVAGRKLVLMQPEKDNLSYIKVDSNGEIIQVWEYLTDSLEYYTYNSFSLNDDYIFFGGAIPCTWTAPLEFYPEQRWIFLNKISHAGEIAWQKFYKGEVNYMPYKILATNDGGALIFSTKYDWNDPIPDQRDLHILKIDSTGYYTPLTGTEEEFEQMEKQILVYPNPVENKVNFIFGLYNDLEINIFDLFGNKEFYNVFKHSAIIDLSHLKPGIYPYTISGRNGFYEQGKLVKK